MRSRANELMKYVPYNRIQSLVHSSPETLVRVYTYQGEEAYQAYLDNGYFSGDSNHVESEDHPFTDSYRWLKSEMNKKIPDFSGDYPVWGWIKRPSSKNKPRKYTGTREPYRIVALIPRSRIVFSDYDTWHCVLNNSPVVNTEDEFDSFIGDVQSTWNRVFEFEKSKNAIEHVWKGTGERFRVQVCVDRIHKDEIVSVRKFL